MHGLPSGSAKKRKWTILAGAISVSASGARMRPVEALDKELNKSQIKTYIAPTSQIEFATRGTGGAVKKTHLKKEDAIPDMTAK